MAETQILFSSTEMHLFSLCDSCDDAHMFHFIYLFVMETFFFMFHFWGLEVCWLGLFGVHPKPKVYTADLSSLPK